LFGATVAGALSSSAVALGAFVGGVASVHRSELADAWDDHRGGLRGCGGAATTNQHMWCQKVTI
jgi:hypothetical protein